MLYSFRKKDRRAGSDGGLSFTFQGGDRGARRKLAAELRGGGLVAFTGGLGAGKTAFCAGIARGLGCTDPVSSPTFSIVNVYRGPVTFAHFDMYRIRSEEDLYACSFYDYLDAGAAVAVEWSENIADFLEEPYIGSRSKIWAATSEKLL